MALALRRAKDSSTLLFAGGVWDRIEHVFVRQTPDEVCCIDLEESQVEYTSWFAEFLRDFREGYPRDISAALIAGDRRAGKTFDAYFCQWSALIDVPLLPSTGKPAIGWTISKTYKERDELDQLVATFLPEKWFDASRAPEHRYDLKNGSVLRNLSADDPDSLKQGVVDWLLYNEGQKMAARAVVNGLYGTADRAGLCMIACNKPTASDSRGEWLFDLREAINDEQVSRAKGAKVEPLGIKFFGFSSKDNTKIDQPARRRVGRLAAIIDPGQAEADDADAALDWKRPGDKALWEFEKHRHLQAQPQLGARDVTCEVVAERGEYGTKWTHVAGIDFDFRPHIVCVINRIFGSADDPTFHSVDEFAGEKLWTVKQWIEEFAAWGEARGYTPETLLFIGDASSGWRRPEDPKLEDEDRNAFEVIQGAGWTIIPPQDHRGATGRARNPRVDERLDLANDHLRRDRWFIDPIRCPWLAECAREALTERKMARRRLVHNKHAHAIDASTYPIWRLAPRSSGGFSPTAKDIVRVRAKRPASW